MIILKKNINLRSNIKLNFYCLFQINYFKFLCQHDSGLSKTARNILREWMVKEVQQLYSLRGGHANKKLKAGQQKKHALNKLTIYSIIQSKYLYFLPQEKSLVVWRTRNEKRAYLCFKICFSHDLVAMWLPFLIIYWSSPVGLALHFKVASIQICIEEKVQ